MLHMMMVMRERHLGKVPRAVMGIPRGRAFQAEGSPSTEVGGGYREVAEGPAGLRNGGGAQSAWDK